MKFIQIILILFLLPLVTIAGNDTIYLNSRWKEMKSRKRASYYRLIDQLPNGLYKCTDFYRTDTIQMIGYYKDKSLEKQDSTFDFYSENGLLLEHYRIKNDQVRFSYETVISNDSVSDTLFTTIDTMATFHDHPDDINKFILNYLEYPEKASKNDVGGVVLLSFVIDEFGQIKNVEVVKSLGYGCDEEAIAVVKHMPLWTPGKYHGHKVKCKYFLPIRFNMY